MTKLEKETLEKMADDWETSEFPVWDLDDAIRHLRQYAATVKPSEEWRDISTSPIDGTPIDLWVTNNHGDGYRIPFAKWQDGHFVNAGLPFKRLLWPSIQERATHWRPIPPAPETSKE